LITGWKNRIHAPGLIPALTGQDLRGLRSLLSQGFGWTLLPYYLCESQLHSGVLEEIPPPLGHTEIRYYLIWLPSSCVSHALRMPGKRYFGNWENNRHSACNWLLTSMRSPRPNHPYTRNVLFKA
jgi:hypothetical protein